MAQNRTVTLIVGFNKGITKKQAKDIIRDIIAVYALSGSIKNVIQDAGEFGPSVLVEIPADEEDKWRAKLNKNKNILRVFKKPPTGAIKP